MSSNSIKAIIALGLVCAINACNGDDQAPKCDENTPADCIDSLQYMLCQNGQYVVTSCPSGSYCETKKDRRTGIIYAACVRSTDTIINVSGECGDLLATHDEECDGNDFRERTCETELGTGATGHLSCTKECKIDSSNCSFQIPSSPESPVCGNGKVEEGEECDVGIGSASCKDKYGTDASGYVSCTQCKLNYSNCRAKEQPLPTSICGNQIVESDEECDGSNLNGATCETEKGPGATGNVWCNETCELIYTSCRAAETPVSCGNGIIEGQEECDGILLNGKNCSDLDNQTSGPLSCDAECHYVTTACKPTPGAYCNMHQYEEYCDNNTVFYCIENEVVSLDCDEFNLTCTKFGKENYADCFPKESECTPGEKKSICDGDDRYSFTVVNECKQADNGNYYFHLTDEYEICSDKCIEETGKCATSTPEISDKGKDCNPYSYTERCENNYMVYCSDDTRKVNTVNCTTTNSSCTILLNDGSAHCYQASDHCNPSEGTYKECENNVIRSYECSIASDGQYYKTFSDEQYCEKACDPQTMQCAKLTADEGEPCDYYDFIERCDDEVFVYCQDDVVNTAYCPFFNASCATLIGQNYGSCFEESFLCDNPDTKTYVCGEYGGYEYSAPLGCYESSNGNNYQRVLSWETEVCERGCNPETGKCSRVVEDEGDPCYSDFEPRCDGQIAVACQNGKVTALDCTEEYGYICDTIPSFKTAGCFSDSARCDTLGATSHGCEIIEGYQLAVTYTCQTSSNGNLYNIITDYEICDHSCNPETVSCTTLVSDEGQPCDTYFKERCDNETVVFCYNNKVVAQDCKAVGDIYSCAVLDFENYASCFTEDDECDVGYEKSYRCGMLYDYFPYLGTYTCAYATNGKKYIYMTDYQYCMESCDEEELVCK